MKRIISTLVLVMGVMSSNVIAKHNVDVIFAVSDSAAEDLGYENIVAHVTSAMADNNKLLSESEEDGLLPVGRTLRSIVRYDDATVNEIANQSYSDAGSELNKQSYDESSDIYSLMDMFGADQFVYVTTSADGVYDGYAFGRRALIINAQALIDNYNLLHHEFGHLDGLTHSIAESNSTDKLCSLMCAVTPVGELTTVFFPEEIEIVNKAIKNEKSSNFSPDAMGHIREELPILANVSIEGETDLSETDGVVTYTVKLIDSNTNEPTFLAADVSLEIYAYAVDQVSSTSLVQVLERVKILAGENEMTFDLELIDDDVYESVENGMVGVRFGDKVNADTVLNVAITSDDPEPVTELPVVEEPVKESSDSSGGSLSWGLLLSLFLLRSRVKY